MLEQLSTIARTVQHSSIGNCVMCLEITPPGLNAFRYDFLGILTQVSFTYLVSFALTFVFLDSGAESDIKLDASQNV